MLKLKKPISLIFIFLGLILLLKSFAPQQVQVVIPPENQQQTLGWKIYKNDEYHFSLKYPEGLLSNFRVEMNGKTSQTLQQLSSLKNTKKDYDPNAYNVIFEADAWKSSETLSDFITQNMPETNRQNSQIIILKNLRGLRISNVDTAANGYYQYNLFKNGNYIYNFALLSDESILIGGNAKLLDGIISTAKFY